MDEQCLKKESTESKGLKKKWAEQRRRTSAKETRIGQHKLNSLFTQSHSKIRRTEISTQYYRNGWMDHLNRFVPPKALDPFSNRTRLHCGTFLSECNSTAVTPHYLTTGSATIPIPPYVNTDNTPALRHTTSIPVPAPHSAIPSSICPLPFYFARPGALPRKGTLLKTKLKIK